MESIGERIKIIRKNNGMTQEEFAERLKIKRNTVATYDFRFRKRIIGMLERRRKTRHLYRQRL